MEHSVGANKALAWLAFQFELRCERICKTPPALIVVDRRGLKRIQFRC